jgi:solute carrier family 13 (sodium-dependent dicarboxylate transporter), member 2/3/5
MRPARLPWKEMNAIPELLSYLLTRLPVIFAFLSGYVLYLLLANTGLTDVFVRWSLKRSRGNLRALLAYIIGVAALLSFFIPNAVTVLALLPFLKTIEKDLIEDQDGRVTTALTLSVIYGANIGGMGSLVGSPANLLLIGALDLYKVPGREQISFLNWFFWSVPLVLFFVAVAWVLVAAFLVNSKVQGVAADLNGIKGSLRLSADQRKGVLLFVFFVSFWLLEGTLRGLWPSFARYQPYASICFFLIFVYGTFVRPCSERGTPFLRSGDVIRGLPKRGLFFLAAVVLLIPVIRGVGLDQYVACLFSDLIRPKTSAFLVFFITTLGVIFLTEFLSNTLVSTAFFPIAYFAAPTQNISPLILMMAVSIASTCAFMTPIATPCNALAFGEMKKTSLTTMILLGLPLNILGGLLITLWLRFVIPWVYA